MKSVPGEAQSSAETWGPVLTCPLCWRPARTRLERQVRLSPDGAEMAGVERVWEPHRCRGKR